MTQEFDRFASTYDAALNRGIKLSGESRDFFIERRIDWTRRCIVSLAGTDGVPSPVTVMDYGCGTGTSFEKLRSTFRAERILGVDVSTAELELARRDFPWAAVATPESLPPDTSADLVYSNGTFHHIPPPQRPAALAQIRAALKPGGYFALWENNPWNPGTRWVMSRIPFDRDAQTLSAPHARRLLRGAGFQCVRTDFLFVFPRFLAPLRRLEPALTRLPLGAQYQVLCRRA